MKNPYYYIGANPTADLVIINPNDEILMIKRSKDSPACAGLWALPGGFVDTVATKGQQWLEGLETPDLAAVREVLEETNLSLDNPQLIFVGVFEGNNRDPRDNQESWSKSYAYCYDIPNDIYESQKSKIVGTDDAEQASWIKIDEVLNMSLAFDHKDIIQTAISKLKKTNKPKV